ncbi:aminotransferase class III-fold pyridoxal phosphate-dependent enzyme [Clostridium sporogenes]|uniref:aminotransferase class III-fold pyridoxal phosphate-dependent enzyme n=1 Tax=Clostridium sporogenes TaxID=1509 RepID=UPI0022386679|nr:aminotransferase class III-fold pyridoxal phosphate-dependent enzyme [Clostridium sporogenes]MCW6109106.1 aminotransferase class III-fold pyridoxal phosphate-dependent enzyme [Clostridium sporogenes]
MISLVKNKGEYIYDELNRRYLDAYSGLWNVQYGFDESSIKNLIKEQINGIPQINRITLAMHQYTELAFVLGEMTHEQIERIIYTCSGMESVEKAVDISRRYSKLVGRNGTYIAIIEGSYHCEYFQKTPNSISGKIDNNRMDEGFFKLPIPFCSCCKIDEMSNKCKDDILEKLECELEKNKEKLCAIIIEPILSNGVIPLFKEYILKLYNFCKKNNILFICDEIASGFGRCGYMFGFHQLNLKPDLITLSKNINNGYVPLGAVCMSKNINDIFMQKNVDLDYLSTQNSNPICVTVALALVKKILSNEMIENFKKTSMYFKEMLKSELQHIDMVFDIRVYGLMGAIDLIDKETGKSINKEFLIEINEKICSLGCATNLCYIENLTSSILLYPQLIIQKKNIEKLVKAIKSSLIEVSE